MSDENQFYAMLFAGILAAGAILVGSATYVSINKTPQERCADMCQFKVVSWTPEKCECRP